MSLLQHVAIVISKSRLYFPSDPELQQVLMILKLNNVQQLCVIILVYVYLFVAIHVGISHRFFPALRAAVLEEVLPGDVVVEFGDGDRIRRIRILVVRASHSSCKMYTEGHPKKMKKQHISILGMKSNCIPRGTVIVTYCDCGLRSKRTVCDRHQRDSRSHGCQRSPCNTSPLI